MGKRKLYAILRDHSALRWVKNNPEPIGQQARWAEIMEEFSFKINIVRDVNTAIRMPCPGFPANIAVRERRNMFGILLS